jgi:hypothetical protein
MRIHSFLPLIFLGRFRVLNDRAAVAAPDLHERLISFAGNLTTKW